MSTSPNEGLGVRGWGLGGGTIPEPRAPTPTVVIGLGNPLMGDDGLGLAALERLRRDWHVPADVELVDGGTWGLSLLPVVEEAGRVLFIDAIATGAAPGTQLLISREDLPRVLAIKVSPHHVDLREVLALAELRGTLPAHAMAIGLEPARVELSDELSEVVGAGLDDLVTAVVRLLAEWGHACAPKAAALHA